MDILNKLNSLHEGPLLWVEDDRDTVEHAAEWIHQETGIDPLWVESLEEAESVLRDQKVGALALDLRIPMSSSQPGASEANGKDLLQRLKDGHYGAINIDIPFLVVTATSVDAGRADLAEVPGFCDVVSKHGAMAIVDAVMRLVDMVGLCDAGHAEPQQSTVASDDMGSEERWRTFVEVLKEENGIVSLQIPGWDPDMVIRSPVSECHESLLTAIRISETLPILCTATVNLDAEAAEQLVPQDFQRILRRASEEEAGIELK